MQPNAPFILFADDDPEDQEMLCACLKHEISPDSITLVSNGEEALSWLRSCDDHALPLLILLDYKMPRLDAPDVLEALRQDSRYDNMAKIVWSTSDNPTYVDQCRTCGADHYFAKPSDRQGLEKIARFLIVLLSERILSVTNAISGQPH